MIKPSTENVMGLLVLSVLLALIVRNFQEIDNTITSLSPRVYDFTRVLQGA
jgi:hypothetical protein